MRAERLRVFASSSQNQGEQPTPNQGTASIDNTLEDLLRYDCPLYRTL